MENKEKTSFQEATEDKRDISFTRKLAEATPNWSNEIPIEEFEDDDEDFSDMFELDKDGNFVSDKTKDEDQESPYTKEQLEELIPEHERLVKLLQSAEGEEFKKEAEEQAGELKQYKEQLKKLSKEDE